MFNVLFSSLSKTSAQSTRLVHPSPPLEWVAGSGIKVGPRCCGLRRSCRSAREVSEAEKSPGNKQHQENIRESHKGLQTTSVSWQACFWWDQIATVSKPAAHLPGRSNYITITLKSSEGLAGRTVQFHSHLVGGPAEGWPAGRRGARHSGAAEEDVTRRFGLQQGAAQCRPACASVDALIWQCAVQGMPNWWGMRAGWSLQRCEQKADAIRADVQFNCIVPMIID